MASRERSSPKQTHESNPYELLGIQETASFDEIRKAYLRNVRMFPPEKDPENFKKIRHAYGLLRDAEKKRRLDLTLFQRESGIEIDLRTDFDFTAAFRGRIFDILLESSDLYVQDFSKRFKSIDKKIEQLR